MADPTLNEIKTAVAELQQLVNANAFDEKTRKAINSFDAAKFEKICADLDAHEAKNQELVKSIEAAKTRETEFKDQLHAIELELARGAPSAGKNYRETAEFKALQEFVKRGDKAFIGEHAVDVKTLRTDSDPNGGYLVPMEMDTAITKKITEISAIRSIARVRTITSKSLQVPVRNTIPTATYEGETETGGDSNSTYQNVTITPFRQTFTTPVTMDQLMDSAFDMEAEIFSDAREAFAKGEGAGFVSGSGFKDPEGFLVNAEILAAVRTSTTSATIDPEDIINLSGDLKVGYDPVYVFNRSTMAFIRTLKSTTGQFLWQPGLNGPVANTINGYSYLLAQDMPDIASNSLSIAFGDFRRGYTIVDRTGLSIIRDDLTNKKQAIVEFTFHRWNTGQVTLAEAIKVLKTKA